MDARFGPSGLSLLYNDTCAATKSPNQHFTERSLGNFACIPTRRIALTMTIGLAYIRTIIIQLHFLNEGINHHRSGEPALSEGNHDNYNRNCTNSLCKIILGLVDPPLGGSIPGDIRCLGLGTLVGPTHDARRLGWSWKGDLRNLFLLLPPIAGAIFLPVRSKTHVLVGRDPGSLAKFR